MKWTLPQLALFLCVATLRAAPPTTAPTTGPTVILVVGAEGEPTYAPLFAQWADRWERAARDAGATVIPIGRGPVLTPLPTTLPATAPSTSPATAPTAPSDKGALQAYLAAEGGADVDATRPLWLVLIGHGTHDGQEAKFNLRGPDVSDRELASWLEGCRRPLAIVNCSSSSAPFLNRLSGKGRIVITATQSGQELQFSRFGGYLSAAIADPTADLDKDGQTSLLEAFLAASARVEAFYKGEGRLVTEHALLDDNGDALGTPGTFFQGTRAIRAAKGGAALDGGRAHQWHLVPSDQERAMPADVRRERDALEFAIEALRAKRATMAEDEYLRRLEPLMLGLAKFYQSAEGTSGAQSR